MFISSFHYFRGFAILIIIAGHVHVGNSELDYPTFTNLVSGSTALFVFISGYLFQHLQKGVFNYPLYLNKKFKYVILPYLICSTPAIINIAITGKFHPLLGDVTAIEGSVINLLTGRHVTAYWYVPFAALLFMSAPIIVKFSLLKHSMQLSILFIFSIIAIYAHRPIGGLNPFHSFLYYIPFYLFGIYAVVNRDLIEKIKKYNVIFLIATVLLAYFQVNFMDVIGSSHKDLFTFSGIDIMYLQKVFLLLFVITSLNTLENKNVKPLSFFANISFSLYFIHGYVLILLARLSINDTLLNYGFNESGAMLIKFTLVVVISSLLSISIIKILGKRSRYFIGS
ncbi:acyltransferase [Moritella sp. 5]|uniref:acyltransferase family protein n=1 Tax=Moritella sp. 5 TaxID=2746231 RepID=UPI001BA8B47E|nr:acyltransferase [Moritella sp. 5]QUM80704.1 acyltransferase [Moritella sp. 5]